MPNTAYSTVSKKSGKTYYLHSKKTIMKGGREMTLYFFAGEIKPEGALAELPAGKEIIENARTGLPMLRTIK